MPITLFAKDGDNGEVREAMRINGPQDFNEVESFLHRSKNDSTTYLYVSGPSSVPGALFSTPVVNMLFISFQSSIRKPARFAEDLCNLAQFLDGKDTEIKMIYLCTVQEINSQLQANLCKSYCGSYNSLVELGERVAREAGCPPSMIPFFDVAAYTLSVSDSYKIINERGQKPAAHDRVFLFKDVNSPEVKAMFSDSGNGPGAGI